MNDLSELVTLSGGKTVTSSRVVAKYFKKRHKNILQLYQDRILGRHSANFTGLNFQPSEYIDPTGRVLPEILMTKDGFIAIATKLHGAEEWQERFIEAFNAMSEQIERISMTMWMRRLAIETKDANSFTKASIGAHFMLERKHELPAIREEREKLKEQMEPSLFPVITTTTH
jgi:Rha family phage regulatory protein